MNTFNSYTANNSTVNDVMLDQVIEHKAMNNVAPNHVGIDGLVTTNESIMDKHSFFKCTQCRWEDNELVMCPKCSKFNEKWLEATQEPIQLPTRPQGRTACMSVKYVSKIDDRPEVESNPIDGGSNWELLGCLIYVFGIIAAFVLLIWSTM